MNYYSVIKNNFDEAINYLTFAFLCPTDAANNPRSYTLYSQKNPTAKQADNYRNLLKRQYVMAHDLLAVKKQNGWELTPPQSLILSKDIKAVIKKQYLNHYTPSQDSLEGRWCSFLTDLDHLYQADYQAFKTPQNEMAISIFYDYFKDQGFSQLINEGKPVSLKEVTLLLDAVNPVYIKGRGLNYIYLQYQPTLDFIENNIANYHENVKIVNKGTDKELVLIKSSNLVDYTASCFFKANPETTNIALYSIDNTWVKIQFRSLNGNALNYAKKLNTRNKVYGDGHTAFASFTAPFDYSVLQKTLEDSLSYERVQ